MRLLHIYHNSLSGKQEAIEWHTDQQVRRPTFSSHLRHGSCEHWQIYPRGSSGEKSNLDYFLAKTHTCWNLSDLCFILNLEIYIDECAIDALSRINSSASVETDLDLPSFLSARWRYILCHSIHGCPICELISVLWSPCQP